MQAARESSVHASNKGLGYNLDCTRLHTPRPLTCMVPDAPYHKHPACLTYTIKDAQKMLLCILPSTLLSMLTSTLPGMLSQMLPIVLDGILPTCIAAYSQISAQNTSNHQPNIMQCTPSSSSSSMRLGKRQMMAGYSLDCTLPVSSALYCSVSFHNTHIHSCG